MQQYGEFTAVTPRTRFAQVDSFSGVVPEFSGVAPLNQFAQVGPVSGLLAPDVQQYGEFSGVILSIKGKFGFIKQDNNADNMFVMPGACEACGGAIPPPGTMVTYDVVV